MSSSDLDAAKEKTAAKEQAKKEAAEKLAAAQKEMAERYPEHRPYFVAEEVVAEGTIEPVTSAKPPKPGTVVAEGTVEPQPEAPAVPRKGERK